MIIDRANWTPGRLAASSLCALGLLAAPLAHAAAAEPDFARIEVKAQRLADNFHVIDETPAHGGSISILTGPDGVVLVDTGVGGLVAKVEVEIKRLSPLPVRYVLTTHAHVDEIGGHEHFARLGATIVGRDQTRFRMLNPRRPAADPAVDGRTARQARAVSVEAAPKLTFATEMNLHLNGQDIRMISVPRAHTDNDAIIVFPGLDIVVTGDTLRAHEYPSINRPDGGTLRGMLDGLSVLIGLGGPKTRYVTAHGQIVDRSVVVAQRDMLLTSRDRIAALIAQGKTVQDVVAAKVVEGLGAEAAPGHVGPEAFARDVYNELTNAP